MYPLNVTRKEPYNTDRARKLRRDQTPPEGVLWSKLRAKRLGGIKFRRQHPIGPYVVDFCCADAMLVVEVDSMYHIGRREQDRKRDADLAERGYKVMRISAGDIASNMDGVLSTIRRVVEGRLEDMKKGKLL